MQADAEGLSYDLLSSWGGKSWLSRSLGSIPVVGPPRGWAARMDRKDQVNTSWPQPAFYTWRDTTLNEKKARFQQRQLEEKEQKLVRMYESAQAQALKRVGGAATTAPQNPGKVRQMFEERRTRAGIDKSHPLQPLGPPAPPGATRPQGSRPAPRPQQNGAQRVQTTTSHPDGDYVRKEVVEIKQRSSNHDLPNLSKTHRFESERIFRDHNLNSDEFLDDVTFPDGISFDQLTLDPISNKLPNVGGALPSQRQAKQSEANNNIIVTKNGTTRKVLPDERIMGPRGNAINSPNGEGRGKGSPVERARATPPKTLRTTTTIKPKVSQTSSPTVATPPTPVKARTPVEPKPRTPIRTVSAASPRRMASKAESPPTGEGSGERCKICNRQFASERLAKHQEICAKQKKRKPYDAIKHRIAGTDVEPYVKVVKKAGKVQTAPRSGPVTLRPNNWRKKHEDFINAIRAAKQVTLHIKKGGKLSDLPPPPPSDTSDYVSCPHCGRRFNASAAERHIPKCASFQFNKKPQPAKKR